MTLHLPLWGQDGAYPASLDRQFITAALGSAKVLDGLVVGPRGLGANMSVDISAGRVVMPGPNGSYLGYSDALENRAIGPAPTTGTSRIDLVVAEVTDPQAMGSGDELSWDIVVVPGVAAASPIAPDVPDWATPLATVAVAATTVSIAAAAILDHRFRTGVLGVLRTTNRGSTDAAGGTVGSVRMYVGANRLLRLSMWAMLSRDSAGLSRLGPYVDGFDGSRNRTQYIQNRHTAAGGAGQEANGVEGWCNIGAAGLRTIGFFLQNPSNTGVATVVDAWMVVEDVGPADPNVYWFAP